MQSTEEMYLAAEQAARQTLARWAVVAIVDAVTALAPSDACKTLHLTYGDDKDRAIAALAARIAALEAEMAKLKTLPVINYSGIMREE